MKAQTNTLPLFPDDQMIAPDASGSAWEINLKDPATVPVPFQVVISKVEGPYTEQDRKLWTFLLHAVWDDLGDDPDKVVIHDLAVADINRVFRDIGGQHDSAWIWESAKRLAKTTVEWEDKIDDRLSGISSLFSAVISRSCRSSGRLKFNFPPLLIPIIKQPSRFARLRLHFLIKLSGKYAVTLYEILEGYANMRDPTFTVALDELRRWLKVPDASYDSWKDFRRWVLDPAVAQINQDPLGAGFSVAYLANRDGRFYKSVTFTVTKTNRRVEIERQIRRNMTVAALKARPGGRPFIHPDSYAKARKAAPGLDVHGAESEFWSFWEASGSPAFTKGVDAAFIGFCRKKAKKLH